MAGQIYAIFVIMLAAAEAAVGLAIVLAIFQLFHTIDVEAAETLKRLVQGSRFQKFKAR